MRRKQKRLSTSVALLLASASLAAQVLPVEGHNFNFDTSPLDGSIALDYLDSIWTMPANGGLAKQLTDSMTPASRPRWSPDGRQILYQTRTRTGAELWQIELATGMQLQLMNSPFHVQDAAWHPDGARLIFASEQGNTDLDLFELDVSTGLTWRLTNHSGAEIEPAWSANGQHLAYVRKTGDSYILVLRPKGEPEVELLVSESPLSSPSWRPDGSILTFLRQDGNSWELQMAILSTPALIRTISSTEDFFTAPVRWHDRMRMLYAADGQIRTRGFEDRRSRPLYFRAAIEKAATVAPRIAVNRELDIVAAPDSRLVIRAARLFDGIWSGYRHEMDVLTEGGLIAAIEPRRDWPEDTILDLGDTTLMPGLIDSWSALPESTRATDGAALLAYGITTLVSPDRALPGTAPLFAATDWESELTPGPRLLPAGTAAMEPIGPSHLDNYLVRLLPDQLSMEDAKAAVADLHGQGIPVLVDSWNIGRRTGANVFLGTDWLTGRETAQITATGAASFTLISGLADAGTPGMDALLRSRQASVLGHAERPGRRVVTVPQLGVSSAFVVAGSRPNQLPPGLALHAELRALAAAGLDGESVLRAAGRNAAILLGLENRIGTITPGAAADMLLISGDPIAQSGDLIRIVAVIRNGRFFSLVNLLESASRTASVE